MLPAEFKLVEISIVALYVKLCTFISNHRRLYSFYATDQININFVLAQDHYMKFGVRNSLIFFRAAA